MLFSSCRNVGGPQFHFRSLIWTLEYSPVTLLHLIYSACWSIALGFIFLYSTEKEMETPIRKVMHTRNLACVFWICVVFFWIQKTPKDTSWMTYFSEMAETGPPPLNFYVLTRFFIALVSRRYLENKSRCIKPRQFNKLSLNLTLHSHTCHGLWADTLPNEDGRHVVPVKQKSKNAPFLAPLAQPSHPILLDLG